MRAIAACAVLAFLSGCAGILHAPAEGRRQDQSAEAALLSGMNLDFLGPPPHTPAVPAEVTDPSLPDLGTLTPRVARTPVDAAAGPPVLFVGARLGNELVPSVTLTDPHRSDTLDLYFDHWVTSARAALLLDHARVMLAREAAPDYSAWTEEQAAAQRSKDAADAARIARIVSEGGYVESWAPFVDAYRGFRAAVLKEVPEGPPSPALVEQVDGIARAHGLHGLAAELPIEPRHVAAEMLRLVTDVRRSSGGTEGKLLYACNGGIRIRPGDVLGDRLLDALAHPDDPITRAFGRLQENFAAWEKDHPQADQLDQDAYLHRAAEETGLLRLLAEAEDPLP